MVCCHTSSRFDCFALLALKELEAASLGAPSNLGRGMFEGLSVKPLLSLFLGVPLYVPAADMVEITLVVRSLYISQQRTESVYNADLPVVVAEGSCREPPIHFR